jgi:hypothetical protein
LVLRPARGFSGRSFGVGWNDNRPAAIMNVQSSGTSKMFDLTHHQAAGVSFADQTLMETLILKEI